MKNVIVKIEAKTSQVFLTKKTLGISGENLQGNIVISFVDKFVNGVAELKMQMPDGTLGSIHLDKVNESYVLPIRSSLLTQVGYIYMQLKITESGSEIPIFKSNDFYLEVKKAIETETTIPEEYPTWEEILNEKIAEVNNAIQEVNNLDIDIEENILTITKKDGSKKSQNVKGEPGTPGKDGINGTNGKDGVDGKDGITPTLKVGTTTTGEAGTNANVEMLQNGTEYTLNFTIPKGKDGTGGSGGNGGNGGNVDLSDYALKSELPTKTSQLTNDSGFITEHQDLSDYAKKTDIPNVDGFVTKDVSNLTNYYNKTEIDDIIGDIETMLKEV